MSLSGSGVSSANALHSARFWVGLEGQVSEGSVLQEATKGETMSRRGNPSSGNSLSDRAMTWFFAGLVVIALVAGIVGRVAAG
jgi:hypothetical protein